MKVGLLFPEFGSQHVGMGKELYDTSRLMQEYFEEASHCLNTNFVKLCFASSDHELARIQHGYASLFLMSSAIGSLVAAQGIKPVAVAGFGVGEFAALQYAGSLSFPDGLYFLTKYAQLYQSIQKTHSLKSVYIDCIDIRSLKQYCKEVSTSQESVGITAFISLTGAIIAGHKPAVDRVAALVKEGGGKVHHRLIDGGLHSQLMQPIAEALEMYCEKVDIKDAHIPVISCVDGIARIKGDLLLPALLDQITAPVRWDKLMLHVALWDVVLEIGPGSTLTHLIKAAWPNKQIYTINKQADIDELAMIVLAQKPDKFEGKHGSITSRNHR